MNFRRGCPLPLPQKTFADTDHVYDWLIKTNAAATDATAREFPTISTGPRPNSDTGGEFVGRSGCGLECSEARDAHSRDGNAREPLRDATS